MVRIEGQVGRLTRIKEDFSRENAVLKRENERLRARLAEITADRDILEKRVRFATRRVETALTQLNLLSEES